MMELPSDPSSSNKDYFKKTNDYFIQALNHTTDNIHSYCDLLLRFEFQRQWRQ